jgi:hypothetical protein
MNARVEPGVVAEESVIHGWSSMAAWCETPCARRTAAGNHAARGRTVGLFNMDSNDDMTSRILASLAALPLHEQADAISALIGSVIKEMPPERILEIRDEIASELDARIPVVQATLDLIDGQLALREIAGEADWR